MSTTSRNFYRKLNLPTGTVERIKDVGDTTFY